MKTIANVYRMLCRFCNCLKTIRFTPKTSTHAFSLSPSNYKLRLSIQPFSSCTTMNLFTHATRYCSADILLITNHSFATLAVLQAHRYGFQLRSFDYPGGGIFLAQLYLNHAQVLRFHAETEYRCSVNNVPCVLFVGWCHTGTLFSLGRFCRSGGGQVTDVTVSEFIELNYDF